MSRNGRCTSLTARGIAWSDRTDGGPRLHGAEAPPRRIVDVHDAEKFVGQALRLPDWWQAMRLPYKSFRELRLSPPNHAQRHKR
jgi:hypothetical protein